MDCRTPGFPVHHQIPELTQIYVHRVGDAIQPSHPLSFQTSQFVTSGGQNIGASAAASVVPMNIQDGYPLELTGLISLLSKGFSRFLSTTVQKHQFFGAQPSLWSNSHITLLRLDESQAGIKTAGRNISNLIYADDTTLMAESREELKSL